MKKIITYILLAAMLFSLAACGSADGETPEENIENIENAEEAVPATADPVDDNYRTFYQIFVGSFSDSNNDGIGDLRGIINRFDYLNDGNLLSETSLGVQGIWLSPIFSSPSYHKYDVSDYYEVDWRFGLESDLKELIELCHERNVKIILDLVINHSSSRHPWFQAFKEARMNGDTENPYYDFYSCVTTAEKVGGRTYQKIAGVDCWYECNFSGEMPELNYDNPEVFAAMLDVAKYYLDMGVDGFRFDAVKYIYFGDTQRSVEFWEKYMAELRAIKPDIYCVGECWSGEAEIMEYIPAMDCFNFAMSQAEGVAASAAKGFAINKFTNYVESYQNKLLEINPNAMAMSFLSNHDMDRIGGAFIVDSNMRMAANLYLLSPGSPFIYYGEEIGIRGSRGGEATDANRRLAMLWGDDDLVRDPVGSTYSKDKQISTTVADQLSDEGSLLRYYCRLLTIRHSYPAIARGSYDALDFGKNFGGFKVEYEGETIFILHNNSTNFEAFTLELSEIGAGEICEVIGVGGAGLEGGVLTLDAQTSVILK
ncbi:MAG: hypothetical protein IKV79_04130 [Oscillospiraceae bacterium]|nr:hypothetical protein [Oscillospiraceae bacterium]